eukprot:900078-Amphidinium_carterae.1
MHLHSGSERVLCAKDTLPLNYNYCQCPVCSVCLSTLRNLTQQDALKQGVYGNGHCCVVTLDAIEWEHAIGGKPDANMTLLISQHECQALRYLVSYAPSLVEECLWSSQDPS